MEKVPNREVSRGASLATWKWIPQLWGNWEIAGWSIRACRLSLSLSSFASASGSENCLHRLGCKEVPTRCRCHGTCRDGSCNSSLFPKWEQGTTEKPWRRQAERNIICTSNAEELFHLYAEGKARCGSWCKNGYCVLELKRKGLAQTLISILLCYQENL